MVRYSIISQYLYPSTSSSLQISPWHSYGYISHQWMGAASGRQMQVTLLPRRGRFFSMGVLISRWDLKQGTSWDINYFILFLDHGIYRYNGRTRIHSGFMNHKDELLPQRGFLHRDGWTSSTKQPFYATERTRGLTHSHTFTRWFAST